MENGRRPATKQDLADLEKRLTESFTARFATKKDLADLEKRLREAIHDSETKMAEAIHNSEARMAEAIHDSETRLLTAFYSFAESNQKHLRDVARSNLFLQERVSVVETRVLEIEKRLNMPPPRHGQ